jgi:hypothetical protein
MIFFVDRIEPRAQSYQPKKYRKISRILTSANSIDFSSCVPIKKFTEIMQHQKNILSEIFFDFQKKSKGRKFSEFVGKFLETL